MWKKCYTILYIQSTLNVLMKAIPIQLVMKLQTLGMDLCKVLLAAAAVAFVIQTAINLFCSGVGESVGVIV
jgi:hypothetical protein